MEPQTEALQTVDFVAGMASSLLEKLSQVENDERIKSIINELERGIAEGQPSSSGNPSRGTIPDVSSVAVPCTSLNVVDGQINIDYSNQQGIPNIYQMVVPAAVSDIAMLNGPSLKTNAQISPGKNSFNNSVISTPVSIAPKSVSASTANVGQRYYLSQSQGGQLVMGNSTNAQLLTQDMLSKLNAAVQPRTGVVVPNTGTLPKGFAGNGVGAGSKVVLATNQTATVPIQNVSSSTYSPVQVITALPNLGLQVAAMQNGLLNMSSLTGVGPLQNFVNVNGAGLTGFTNPSTLMSPNKPATTSTRAKDVSSPVTTRSPSTSSQLLSTRTSSKTTTPSSQKTDPTAQSGSITDQVGSLREVLNQLIKMASDHPQKNGERMKEASQQLLDGKMPEDVFVKNACLLTGSDKPAAYLSYFKKLIPALRKDAEKQKAQSQQVLTSSTSLQIAQAQLAQLQAAAAAAGVSSPKLVQQQIFQVPGSGPSQSQSVLQLASLAGVGVGGTGLPVMGTSNPAAVVGSNSSFLPRLVSSASTPTLATTVPKGLAQGTQYAAFGNNKVAVSTAQQPSNSRVGSMAGQGHFLLNKNGMLSKSFPTPPSRPIGVAGSSAPSNSKIMAAQLNNRRPNRVQFPSNGSNAADDDINDVTSMAGVNLLEEKQRILAGTSDILGHLTRSCKEVAFLNMDQLKERVEAIVSRNGVKEVPTDVMKVLSQAAQLRLRDLVERCVLRAVHRINPKSLTSHSQSGSDRCCSLAKGGSHTTHESDVKSAIKVFEELDEVERKRLDARNREMMMRAMKSRSRSENPEQMLLKEKAKQLQQQEEEVLRKKAANLTAVAAIGPRKKRKLNDGSANTVKEESKDTPAQPNSTQSARSRPCKVSQRDVQQTMRQYPEFKSPHVMYKLFCK